MKFKDFINELFNTAYKVKEETTDRPGHYRYYFKTDEGQEYRVTIISNSVLYYKSKSLVRYEILFQNLSVGRDLAGRAKSMEILGTGDSFKVFSTVLAVAKAFIQKHEKDKDFGGFYFECQNKPSRLKLYKAFVEKAKKGFPKYYYRESADSANTRFIFDKYEER